MGYDFIKNGMAGAMKSPIADQVSALASNGSGSSLASGVFSSAGSAMADVQALASSAQAHMASKMASAYVQMPIMAAVERQEKSALSLSGIRPGTTAGGSLSSAFQTMTDLPGILASAQSSIAGHMSAMAAALPSGTAGSTTEQKLANFAATAPAQTIDDPANPGHQITNPAYTSWLSSNSTTINSVQSSAASMAGVAAANSSTLTSMISAENASISGGIATLKERAFANFCASGSHPPAVRNILNKFVEPPSAQTYVSQDLVQQGQVANSAIATSQEPIRPAVPNWEVKASTTPAPEASTQTVPIADLEHYNSLMTDNYVTLSNSTTTNDQLMAALTARKREMNYDAVKQDAVDNPGDSAKQALYQQYKTQIMADPAFTNYDAHSKAHNKAMARNALSKQVFQKYRDGGCPQGINTGTETFGTITINTLTAKT